MKIEGKEYRTIWFDEKSQTVKIIDQTKLPHQFIIKDLKTVKDAINAIKIMEVRGAPLIGGTAAYGIVLAIMEKNDLNFIKKSSEDLIQSRPTAINLKWAVDRMMKKLSGVNSNEILKIALNEAKEICEEDVKFCENIGINGLKIIEEIYNKKKDTVNILTLHMIWNLGFRCGVIASPGRASAALAPCRRRWLAARRRRVCIWWPVKGLRVFESLWRASGGRRRHLLPSGARRRDLDPGPGPAARRRQGPRARRVGRQRQLHRPRRAGRPGGRGGPLQFNFVLAPGL